MYVHYPYCADFIYYVLGTTNQSDFTYYALISLNVLLMIDKLSMDRMGFERSELQGFCCKNILLRRLGSFNGLVELCHLLLMGAEKLQKKRQRLPFQTH